jgi:hypothetical protein
MVDIRTRRWQLVHACGRQASALVVLLASVGCSELRSDDMSADAQPSGQPAGVMGTGGAGGHIDGGVDSATAIPPAAVDAPQDAQGPSVDSSHTDVGLSNPGMADGAPTAVDGAGSNPPDAHAPTANIIAPSDGITVGGNLNLVFSSSAPNAGFECSLDDGQWTACVSPKYFSGLAPGDHRVSVRAVAGGISGGLTSRNFTVDTSLLLYYQFEGTGINEGFERSRTAFVTSSAMGSRLSSYVAGKFGNAIEVADREWIQVDDIRSVLGSYPSYTFSLWYFARSLTQDPQNPDGIFDFLQRVVPAGGISMSLRSTGAFSLCMATNRTSLLTGSCPGPRAPALGLWHNITIRYMGDGLSEGQGAAEVEILIDGNSTPSRRNDSFKDPVFNQNIPDSLTLGSPGMIIDEVRIYKRALPDSEICTALLRGTVSGSGCSWAH